MSLQVLIAFLVTITALASFINQRYIHLSKSIGLTLISLGISLIIIFLLHFGQNWAIPLKDFADGIDFNAAIMKGMLSFLLFAAALHVDVLKLSSHKTLIATMATVGVFVSALLVGYCIYYVANLVGIHIGLLPALLFGALIAPTDPISVINVMKESRTPRATRVIITGESLFNDAAGILLFVILSRLLTGETQHLDIHRINMLLLQEGVGGIILGYLLGQVTIQFLKRINNEETSILITLAIVTGGYTLANALHVSGPITMVIAGLIVGSQIRKAHFPNRSINGVYRFWELIDGMLNAFFFVLIGLEMLSINANLTAFLIGLGAFFIIILARIVSTSLPLLILEPAKAFNWKTLTIMTWGGMRGGLSIALALSVQAPIETRDIIINITYAVVVLSIVIQGLSIKPLVQWLYPQKVKSRG